MISPFVYHGMIHFGCDCRHKRQTRGGCGRDRYGKGFPGDLVKRSRVMLSAMDAAVVLEDPRSPPGNHLEALRGDRAGQHSVGINEQWRICFVWTEQEPADDDTDAEPLASR